MINLSQWFDTIYVDSSGTIHLTDPKYDDINSSDDKVARVLQSVLKNQSDSDAAIGAFMSLMGNNVQLRYGDAVYPQNIVLNVIFNIIHKPYATGEGVGTHMNLGLQQCLQQYIRGLEAEEKRQLEVKLGKSVCLETGEYSCDIGTLEEALKEIDVRRHFPVVIDLPMDRRNRTDSELVEMFNKQVDAFNQRSQDNSGPKRVCFKLEAFNSDIHGVKCQFKLKSGIFDAVAHGAVDNVESIKASGEMDKQWVAQHCPKYILELSVDGDTVEWLEEHFVSMLTFRRWMNVPEESPACMTISW